MHHGRGHRGPWGFRRGVGRGWYERGNVLERLETYHRGLEQELADVSDLIKRLRDSEPQPTTSV
jgi:hypothetical protein